MKNLLFLSFAIFLSSCTATMTTEKVSLENGKRMPEQKYQHLLTPKERVKVSYYECDTVKTVVGLPEKIELETLTLKSDDSGVATFDWTLS